MDLIDKYRYKTVRLLTKLVVLFQGLTSKFPCCSTGLCKAIFYLYTLVK